MEQERSEGVDWDGLSTEVLEMIFCHLPVNDLLSCSVVSKNWKKGARDVLKRSRECYAHINDFHRDIQNLNEMIASTDLTEMINGLHIRNQVKPKDESGSASSVSQKSSVSSDVKIALNTDEAVRKLEDAKQRVHQVLCVEWRYLNLDCMQPWGPALSAEDASLLREVIFAASGSLEKLLIGREEDWKLVPCTGNEYTKLRVIQLLNRQLQHVMCTQIFSQRFAPKLEEITGGMIHLYVNHPMRCFAMERLKSVMLRYNLKAPGGIPQKAFRSVSGLRRLALHHSHLGPYEEEQQQKLLAWTEFVLSLVLRSLDTIEELHIDALDLYNLVKKCNELKFPNLRCLRLATRTHKSVVIENEISILKQLNLAKRCLNLEQVELTRFSSSYELQLEMMGPLEEYAGLEQSSLPMKIVLHSHGEILGAQVHDYLTFFNTIYPNAVQVNILNLEERFVFKVGSIIWEMKSLEYLEINILQYSFLGEKFPWELDALLCGINIEEAKLLFEERPKSNAELNAVVVPIRPSLFNAKNLKELKITEVWGSCNGKVFQYSCVIPVTENIPTRYERKLKVTFEGSELWYNKLKQLKAFSTFRSAQVHENYKMLDLSQYLGIL